MRPGLSLAHEARIASLESQLAKAIARIKRLESVKRKPKPEPMLTLGERAARVAMGKIAAEIAEKHGVTVERMRSQDRRQVFMPARFEAWTLCSEAGFSTPIIGRFFGGRDHTSILHGIGKHKAQINKAPE